MKIVKKIGISIVALIGLLFVIALFIPNDYEVAVYTTIDKPKTVVYDYVKLIKNQENYSIWVMQDPNVQMDYQGVDGTVGFKASWKSNDDNVGEGSQQISAVTDSKIAVDLHFEKPFKGDNKAETVVESLSASQTKVTSIFYGHSPYPMNLLSLIGKKIIRDAQTQNMANLKNILEE